MIGAVCLNPCLDRSAVCRGLQTGMLNRLCLCSEELGGKGVNVAVAAAHLGEKVWCATLTPQGGKDRLQHFLEKEGAAAELVAYPGQLRQNLKLYDEESGGYTELNESGPPVMAKEWEELCRRVVCRAEQSSVLALSGSVPEGVPEDIYARLIERVQKGAGCRCVLDTAGVWLQNGILAAPFLIKPNLEELSSLCGRELSEEKEIASGARRLLETGVEAVVVSMGERGAMLVCRQGAYRAQGLSVEAKGLQGAGDSMVWPLPGDGKGPYGRGMAPLGMCCGYSIGGASRDAAMYTGRI